jgi:hypothetical protein
MDCQRHERYANQFRAMFVMNVEVNWRETWQYSDVQQGLARRHPFSGNDYDEDEGEGALVAGGPALVRKDLSAPYYYTVNCSSCHTQVAVLDMAEEVYHFTGCLASS